MIDDTSFQRAHFTYAAQGRETTVEVNFNPASLEYSITTNSQDAGGNTAQVNGSHSAKLNMELMFDTTDTGDDVRTKTNAIELMLKPAPGEGGANAPRQAAPKVKFEWGAFSFSGVVDSFKQTMDFFSANGVPLRAAVSLSITNNQYQFDQKGSDQKKAGVSPLLELSGGDPSSLATAGGDPLAARAIASANGLESLRAAAGGAVVVGAPVSIGAPAAFSASANTDAFSGLSVPEPKAAGKYFSAEKLLAEAAAPGVGSAATFDITGKAITTGAGGFKAEVGGSGKIRFDD